MNDQLPMTNEKQGIEQVIKALSNEHCSLSIAAQKGVAQ